MVEKTNKVEDLLHQRPPFLFVDMIDICDGAIVGHKLYTSDMFFFKGHFPSKPIVPGVLIVESMAQCGSAGISLIQKEKSGLYVLTTIEKATFHMMVTPGMEIDFFIENIVVNNRMITQKGKALSNGKLVAKAEWICINIDNK